MYVKTPESISIPSPTRRLLRSQTDWKNGYASASLRPGGAVSMTSRGERATGAAAPAPGRALMIVMWRSHADGPRPLAGPAVDRGRRPSGLTRAGGPTMTASAGTPGPALRDIRRRAEGFRRSFPPALGRRAASSSRNAVGDGARAPVTQEHEVVFCGTVSVRRSGA